MVNEQIREELPEDSLVLDNQSYDNSIIGVTLDGRVVYDYDLMIQELMADDNCSVEDAIDWIEYNTLRAIPYMGDKAPIVIQSLFHIDKTN